MRECLLIKESTPFLYYIRIMVLMRTYLYTESGELMEAPGNHQKKRTKIPKSFSLLIIILILLYLFHSVVLQIIGILLIITLICLGFYYLGHLLFRIMAFIIVVSSVICAICVLGYFL